MRLRDEFEARYPLTSSERKDHHKLQMVVESGGGDGAIAELAAFEERMNEKYALDLRDDA